MVGLAVEKLLCQATSSNVKKKLIAQEVKQELVPLVVIHVVWHAVLASLASMMSVVNVFWKAFGAF